MLSGATVLAASLLLALADWPQWLSTAAILLAPIMALALLAPGRIATGLLTLFVVLLREEGQP